MSTSKLSQLRAAVDELQSYELPADFRLPNDGDANNDNGNDDNIENIDNIDNIDNTPLLFYTPQLLTRYKSARDTYLHQSTIDKFLTTLATYDPSTNAFQMPAPVTQEEREELEVKKGEILKSVRETMERGTGRRQEVREKFEVFCEKREELRGVVMEMERRERQRRLEAGEDGNEINSSKNDEYQTVDVDSDDDDDEEITEEELQAQQTQLQEMRQRKADLEKKLRTVRAQVLNAEDDVRRTKHEVNEARVRSGRTPLDWQGLLTQDSQGTQSSQSSQGEDAENAENANNAENAENAENVEYIHVEKEVDAEVAELEERVSELKQSGEFYDGIRELMEELGGVKILSTDGVSDAPNATNAANSTNEANANDANDANDATSENGYERDANGSDKRQKLSQENSKIGGGQEDGFVLTLMLLGSHILEITVHKSHPSLEDSSSTKSHTPNSLADRQQLQVTSARLRTPTTFPMPKPNITLDTNNNNNTNNNSINTNNNNGNDNNNETSISLEETIHSMSFHSDTLESISKHLSQPRALSFQIPPLDDLVEYSHSLESSHAIRFVLVETMARIRTLEARVEELKCLMERYAAQVCDLETAGNHDNGGDGGVQGVYGAEQEVVVAINEGITVAIRLGADCPLLPGSVYISEIYGIGGWEERQLEELKRVVSEKRCKGPLEAMEVLVGEIQRWKREEGWEAPLTPSLPGRR